MTEEQEIWSAVVMAANILSDAEYRILRHMNSAHLASKIKHQREHHLYELRKAVSATYSRLHNISCRLNPDQPKSCT
jgi:hypothetical protein